MTVLTVIGVVAFLVLLLAWWGARVPVVHRLKAEEAGWILEVLLRRGYQAAYATFDTPGKHAFVQVRKYMNQATYGLEFHIPRAEWNRAEYTNLLTEVASLQWPHRREAVDAQREKDVREFLVVDCGQDIQLAVRVLVTVLAFSGVTSDTVLEARVHAVSPRDELVTV